MFAMQFYIILILACFLHNTVFLVLFKYFSWLFLKIYFNS